MTVRPPSPGASSHSSTVCVPNISNRERRKRLGIGVFTFVVSLAILALLLTGDASRWWRLALFPLFWGAATGFFQWRDKT